MDGRPQRERTSQPHHCPWEGSWAARESPAWDVKGEASLMTWQRLSSRPQGRCWGITDREPSQRHGAQRFEGEKLQKKKKPRHNPTEERERKHIWGNYSSIKSPSWGKTVCGPGPEWGGRAGTCVSCRVLHQPCRRERPVGVCAQRCLIRKQRQRNLFANRMGSSWCM